MTLYDIGTDLISINAILDAHDGELDSAPPEFIAWMESTEHSEEQKAEWYRSLLKELRMQAEQARVEAREWQKRAQSRENRMAWLREQMRLHMLRTRQEKIQVKGGSFALRDGKPPLVFTPEADPSFAPLEYVRVSYAWDREAIRSDLEGGASLAFAHLGDAPKELVMR